jgi:hypothetical protein
VIAETDRDWLINRLKEVIEVVEDNHARLVPIKLLKPLGMQESLHSVIFGLKELIEDIKSFE